MPFPWISGNRLTAVDLDAAISAAGAGINVKTYNAKVDGVTDDGNALQAARAAAGLNQTINVPNGQLLKSFNPSSGPATVYWKLDGTTFPGGSQIVSSMGGSDVVEQNFGGKFLARAATSINNQSPILRIDNTTTYGGYTTGFVQSGLKINMTGAAGNNAFNWASSIVLNANSTGGSTNNQDIAYAATIKRAGSSATWQFYGNTTDMTGVAPNSSSSIVVGEFDINCNGPEIAGTTNFAPGTGSRVGLHFPIATYQPPAWAATHAYVSVIPYSVVQPVTPNGFVYVCTVAGTSGSSEPTWPTSINATVTDGTCTWRCGTTVNTQVSRILDIGGSTGVSIGAGLVMSADFYNACIDLSYSTLTASGGSAPAAIRLASNMAIDLSANQTLAGQNQHTLLYNGTKLQYLVAGVEQASITDAGILAIQGNLTTQGNIVAQGTSVAAGTATNDNASAGQVGEYVSATVAAGSAVSLGSSLSVHNITTLSLTAGDWEVRGIVSFIYGVASVTGTLAAVGLVTGAYPQPGTVGSTNAIGAFPALASAVPVVSGVARISLAGTTTVYLTAAGQFTGGTPTAYGTISARRVR